MSMPQMSKQVPFTYEEALERVPLALKSEGFGVLTKIDVKQTLQEKIGVDFRRYMILGACNPKLAHRALGTDLGVGVLLPCNVVVYEADNGKVTVSMVDPEAAIGAFGGAELSSVAHEVKGKLERVLAALS